MSGKEEKIINDCIVLLKQDDKHTKTIVREKLQKMILDHKAKWK